MLWTNDGPSLYVCKMEDKRSSSIVWNTKIVINERVETEQRQFSVKISLFEGFQKDTLLTSFLN